MKLLIKNLTARKIELSISGTKRQHVFIDNKQKVERVYK